MVDWPTMFDSLGIEYVDTGASTAKGNIYVHCPWCGGLDESFHLGVHLGVGNKWKGYGCWKDKRHRGRNPRRLVAGLLNIGLGQAEQILNSRGGGSLPGSGAIQERVKAMKGIIEDEKPVKLNFLPEIRPIDKLGQGKIFLEYLTEKRGYRMTEAVQMCFNYRLRYAMSGHFAYRLIIPVYNFNNELVTWTGRSIADKEPKYRTLTADIDKAKEDNLPLAVGPITDYIWNEDKLVKTHFARGLVLCEGPLDAMRVDYFCRDMGVRATCLFGKVLYDRQYDILMSIRNGFKHKVVILDRDAEMYSHRVTSRLQTLGFRTARLPPGRFNDLGAMPWEKVLDFIGATTS